MREDLEKKVERAIKLIKAAGKIAKEHGQPLEVAYSGGKDSDVILELTRMAGVDYRAIYKNTTIDPPGTIKHAQERGAEILRPNKTFAELMPKYGWPSRRMRFCCSVLKEYKVLDYVIIGVRRDESPKRAERYKEPEECRVYSKMEKARHYFPILDWNTQDVADFLQYRGVDCAPVYYDEEGVFHPERRLGCLCCPLKSKRQHIEDFKKYPNFVKIYLRGGYFYRLHSNNWKNKKYFHNVFEWFVCYLFCDSFSEFQERFGPNLFDGGIDCKEFLENYFNIDLDEIIK